MKRLAYTSILIALLTSTASVQAQAPQRQGAGPAARISTSIPASSMTVTHWYKQNVYDPGDNKIGEIMDVLVDRDGKITALIVAVRRLPRHGREGCRRPIQRCPGHQQGQ